MLPIINWEYVIVYLIIINLIGFFAMGIDKIKAQKGSWRISEKALFMLTAAFGGFGTIAGMYVFRHKTKKLYFTIGFPTILILELAIAIYLIFFWKPNV